MAKRVSKQFGTKTPPKTTRNLPSKGVRNKSQKITAATAPTKSVRVLTSENAKAVGRPGTSKSKWGKIPGVVDGKKSVRRVMRNDPAVGITQPGANVITSAGIDLVGGQSPKVLMQPLPNTPGNRYDNARKSIPTPRKSKPVRSNTPGKVTRSPGS